MIWVLIIAAAALSIDAYLSWRQRKREDYWHPRFRNVRCVRCRKEHLIFEEDYKTSLVATCRRCEMREES